ncbi:hypothetical protein FQN57_001978 [Myotisia sp. PD_48]|nr:hypothetical protein FQN57_001978 [Myotisia sp. PD_48]
MTPSTVRRVVTGHNAEGQAIFESDTQLVPYNPLTIDSDPAKVGEMGFTTVFRTTGFPAEAQGPWTDIHGKPVQFADKIGTTLRVVDFAPGMPGLMHRTISLDFAIVLNGEIELELDGGATLVVKQHDIVIQRGTIHSWNNKGTENVRMLFALVPSKPIQVGEEELEATKLEGLFPSGNDSKL